VKTNDQYTIQNNLRSVNRIFFHKKTPSHMFVGVYIMIEILFLGEISL